MIRRGEDAITEAPTAAVLDPTLADAQPRSRT